MGRVGNKEGSTRKIKDGKWECVIQSKYINPDSKTGSPKRIKRIGDSEEQARKKAKRDLRAWEKAYERNKENLRTSRLKTFGEYMQEFIESEIKGTVTGATYKSYVYTMEANFYNKKISKLQLRMLNIVEFEVYFDQLIHEKSQKTAALPRIKLFMLTAQQNWSPWTKRPSRTGWRGSRTATIWLVPCGKSRSLSP